MATKMKRPCNHPGCGVLITTGSRCAKHTVQYHVNYRKSRTDIDEQRFYGSQVWRELSLEYRHDHPTCEVCKVKPSKLVHHIKHVRDGGERLSKRNLQAVCYGCQAVAHRGNR